MKLITLLTSAGSVAVGYVFGSAAGRSRYRQLTSAATDLLQIPQLQQAAFDLADRAKGNASRLPAPAARLVNTLATRLEDRLTAPTATAEVPLPGTESGTPTR